VFNNLNFDNFNDGLSFLFIACELM